MSSNHTATGFYGTFSTLSPTSAVHAANVAEHLWFLMIVLLQPAVWLKGEISKSWRLLSFLIGSVIGILTYFLLEFVAGSLFISGQASFGLALGFLSATFLQQPSLFW